MDAAAVRRTRLQVLAAEVAAIRAVEPPVGGETELRDLAHRLGLSALCLSGGGIRSAAFCLGVLQALARAKLLARFDYLSTVSGGGYIGSWLQTMIQFRGSPEAAETALGGSDDPPVELLGLRDYTSYISPHAGLFSTDTWTGIVLYVRNVLLNWAVYLPLLLLPILLSILYRTAIWTVAGHLRVQFAVLSAAAVGAAASTYFAARQLPDHRPRDASGITFTEPRSIAIWVCLPAFVWAALAPLSQGVAEAGSPPPSWPLLIAYWAALTVGYCAAWLASWRNGHEARLYGANGFAFGGATFVSAAMVGAGIALARLVPTDEQAQALAVLGPLWLLLATGIHSAVFVGLRRNSLLFDLDREWLARVSALKLRAGALWAIFAFCSLSLTWLLHQPASPPTWVAALVTLATGSVGAWIGKQAGSQVGAVLTAVSRSQSLRTLALNVLAAVFIAGLIAVLGMVTDAGLGHLQDVAVDAWLRPTPQEVWSWPDARFTQPYLAPPWLLFITQVVAVLLLLVLVFWVNRRVNVNRYSMHAVYRNRLTRAFLGAARGAARHPDRFTDFDPDDNLPLAALGDLLCRRRLFPVINMTLNLTRGAAAAWSERKAMAFTATPTSCGAPLLALSGHPVERGTDPPGVYVTTADFAGSENPGADQDQASGLSLATAMTISGAAVSPNWGYHSSTLTAFVMTLFNVRLGAWLPNPAAARSAEELRMAMPPRSLMSLLGDLLGTSGADRPAIYLSDGGHFENLGLYEMLRRRCRLILVIDAGADPDCTFEDLGNALRKAAIDMQITVDFDARPRIAARSNTAELDDVLGFGIASIHYPEKSEPGSLIYLKACLLADVPSDVRAYANLHDTFPHESTLDQFFTESQFESYRALGQFQMERLIDDSPTDDLTALFAKAAVAYNGPAAEIC